MNEILIPCYKLPLNDKIIEFTIPAIRIGGLSFLIEDNDDVRVLSPSHHFARFSYYLTGDKLSKHEEEHLREKILKLYPKEFHNLIRINYEAGIIEEHEKQKV